MRKVWLADLLGSLTYLGQCFRCGVQFMSVNTYVYLCKQGARHCRSCSERSTLP